MQEALFAREEETQNTDDNAANTCDPISRLEEICSADWRSRNPISTRIVTVCALLALLALKIPLLGNLIYPALFFGGVFLAFTAAANICDWLRGCCCCCCCGRGNPVLELDLMVQKTAEGVGMQISDGGQVVRVSTEAASAAGAAVGMQIRAVNGHAVTSKDDIVHAMATVQVGQTVKFTVYVSEQQDRTGGEGEGEGAIDTIP
jgi:hypothetical protein